MARKVENTDKPVTVPRYIYIVEDDNNGAMFTAHRDEQESRDTGELMMDFAKQNNMDLSLTLMRRTLQ